VTGDPGPPAPQRASRDGAEGPWWELHTDRLRLRRWREADLAPFAAMNADPEVMRYFPAPLSRAESDRAVDRFERRFDEQGFGLWALELRATGEFLGFTGLNPMPAGMPGAGGIEVGWRLARRAWRHGYATEAARAAVEVAFAGLGLSEVWSLTAVANTPSEAVMHRLGMRRWALVDHPQLPEGHWLRPHVVYRLPAPGPGRVSPGAAPAAPRRC
jgi:RimJ/RimL family protein N-acetyltransferase